EDAYLLPTVSPGQTVSGSYVFEAPEGTTGGYWLVRPPDDASGANWKAFSNEGEQASPRPAGFSRPPDAQAPARGAAELGAGTWGGRSVPGRVRVRRRCLGTYADQLGGSQHPWGCDQDEPAEGIEGEGESEPGEPIGVGDRCAG